MGVRRVLVLPAGLVWRAVGAGWWVSRGWYTYRPRLLAVVDTVTDEEPTPAHR
ncbi:hypothetical protein [Actinomycetospora aeridis]|uniref:Uncharacterized protein n=1 Tax=Actinomycetospora aeridis TaxID=3129231 RepID=A0ABU8MZM3_9PSEU